MPLNTTRKLSQVFHDDRSSIANIELAKPVQCVCNYFVFLKTENEDVNSADGTQDSQGRKKKEKPVVKKRDSRATFTHPWLACTLKSHSGPVLGFDFSPNGKYLASCSEGWIFLEEIWPFGASKLVF